MFDLEEQGESIKARLGAVAGLNQIERSEFYASIEGRPRALPSASIILLPGKREDQGHKIITIANMWMVAIAARNAFGAQGHYALMDSVIETLGGFQPQGTTKPLSPVSWGMTNEMIGEGLFLSQVTFITEQRIVLSWFIRNP
jgi:hypothetical protein